MKYKAYLFDLDGVIVNTDYIQYNSTKESIYDLINYDISTNNDIDNVFKSTITTLEKLKFLSNIIEIDEEQINKIYERKKKIADFYFLQLKNDSEKIMLMKYLKNNNCKIGIVTNSNKNSTNIILKKIGIYELIDVIITNEDVINKKPNPEPYLKAIEILKVYKNECIIFEDSEVGILSAKNSGIDFYQVKFYLDVNINLLNLLNQ